MAVLPGTQFARREPPGRTGQALWGAPPAGAGERIAEGVERLGAATLLYALDVQKQEQSAEYFEKKRLIDEAGWAAHNAVTGDEEADQAIWEKFQADARIIASSSRYKDVNDLLIQHLNSVSPNWRQGMHTASLKIRADNAKDQFQLNYTKALENGDMPTANEMLSKALELKVISQAEYDHFVKTAPAQAHLERAERFIAQGENNLALTELTKTDKMDLTTEQLKDKRVLKLTAEKAQDDDIRVLLEQMSYLAQEGTTVEEARQYLLSIKNVTPEQRDKALKAFMVSKDLWDKPGGDAWRRTEDYPALVDVMRDIENRKILTYEQIWDRWLPKEKDQTVPFSFDHMLFTRNLLDAYRKPALTGYSASHEIAKLYFARLEDLYVDEEDKIDKPAEFISKRFELEAALKEHWGDAAAIEKAYQGIVLTRKEAEAVGWIDGFKEAWAEGFWAEGPMRRRRRFLEMAKKGEIIDVETEAQRQVVPKGAYYRYDDRVYEKQ